MVQGWADEQTRSVLLIIGLFFFLERVSKIGSASR